MTDNHAICRAHLALVMPEVCKATTSAQRKAAWPWRTGTNLGQGHEFHGPDNFYWHGRACCLWEARAKGWQAWLNAQAPTPEPPRTKYVDCDNNATQHAPWPCVVCGRSTDNRYRLHMIAVKGAPCALHPNDESTYTPGANDLGCHPIGPACMKAQDLTAWAHGPTPGQCQ